MNETTVSDACLQFVPLSIGERPEQQNIRLWLADEKVPNIKGLLIGPRSLEVTLYPCRAVNRLKAMHGSVQRVQLRYECRKTRHSGEAYIKDWGERLAWPSGVTEMVILLEMLSPWQQEAL